MSYNLHRAYRICLGIFFLSLLTCCQQTPPQANDPTETPDRIVLTLAENPTTSVAVTWRTKTSVTSGHCELQEETGTRVDNKNTRTFEAKTTTVIYTEERRDTHANQHSCVITGLTPGKKYIYRVGSENNWSEWFQFDTPDTDSSRFSFIYFGDPQTSLREEWARVIRRAYREAPDCGFMLYAGDIINRAGKDSEWHEFFHAGSYIYATVPQLMTPGNHDYKGLMLDPHWNLQFTFPTNGPPSLPGTCYYVDYKNLKVISIDSAADNELRKEGGTALNDQKEWLDTVLSQNSKEWVIVTTHLPFYSTKKNRDNKRLRKHLQPILEKHGVDIVLTGHDHAYGRGKASDTPGSSHSPVYVVSVSGPKLYPTGEREWMTKSVSHTMMYQVVSIHGSLLSFKAFSVTGEIVDKFELRKNRDGQNILAELPNTE